MSDEVKLNIHEFGEGWAVISFTVPPKDDSQRYFWLHKTLQDWLGINPNRVLQEVQSVRLGARLYGLHVLCTVNKHNYSIDVDNELLTKFGKEYMELVMSDAVQFVATTDTAHPIVALTNRREITVVVERKTERACVMPLDRFRPRLSPARENELDAWLAGSEPGYLVIPLQEFKR